MKRENLIKLGFNDIFIEEIDSEKLQDYELARVTSVNRESYTIRSNESDVYAELIGRIAYGAESPLDFPTVGDWVLADFCDENLAIIHEVLPRKTLLKRKVSGKKVDFQLIGANIDVAFIVQSLNENFNLRRLERYLVMANDSMITPIILLSKSDLLEPEEIAIKIGEVEALQKELEVIQFSNENETDFAPVITLLKPRLSYCLLGSSGVGKTTLINNLIGEEAFETKSVSTKKNKGRHTTTSRQLVVLENGSLIVDTPGMRELGNFGNETGIDETFSEIAELTNKCRFGDCSHTNEKGCAVLQGIEDGTISNERYQNYLKMNKEAAFHEMSYLEKKQKDKSFGKHVKAVMSEKKGRRR